MEMRASATAADSTYAGIVRLARQAAAESAPLIRIADRVAACSSCCSAVAGLAWLLSGSAERRWRYWWWPPRGPPAAGRTGGDVGVIPNLADRRAGPWRRSARNSRQGNHFGAGQDRNVTSWPPRGTDVVVAPGWTIDEVLGLAASADQLSPHVLAAAIVAEAKTRGLSLVVPDSVEEEAGTGVAAIIGGRRVHVGTRYRIVRRGTRRVGRVGSGVVPGRPGRSRGGLGAG